MSKYKDFFIGFAFRANKIQIVSQGLMTRLTATKKQPETVVGIA